MEKVFGLFKEVNSSHLAEYGSSRTGLIHIWSNYKETSLCGRLIDNRLSLLDVGDKKLCKTCDKDNKKRYALVDILPLVFVVSVVSALTSGRSET